MVAPRTVCAGPAAARIGNNTHIRMREMPRRTAWVCPQGPYGYCTLTAFQAAATALYSALPAPYRSLAALRVPVRAPA